jgi:hypothetical protein
MYLIFAKSLASCSYIQIHMRAPFMWCYQKWHRRLWVLPWFSSVVRKTAGYKKPRRRLSASCHGWLQGILSLPQLQWPSAIASRASLGSSPKHPSHHSFSSEGPSVRKDCLPSAAVVLIVNTSLLSPKTPKLLEGSSLLLNFEIPATRYVRRSKFCVKHPVVLNRKRRKLIPPTQLLFFVSSANYITQKTCFDRSW